MVLFKNPSFFNGDFQLTTKDSQLVSWFFSPGKFGLVAINRITICAETNAPAFFCAINQAQGVAGSHSLERERGTQRWYVPRALHIPGRADVFGGKNEVRIELAQQRTPIAKTHRTGTRFVSEPTENLKMFINIHHNTITKTSPQHHHPSLRHQSITDTEQRHHQHKTKASPTYQQNITTQSLHITETRPRHHRHIT